MHPAPSSEWLVQARRLPLLELTLSDHRLSMPVGRDSYVHLDPLNLPESLRALEQARLLSELTSWSPPNALGETARRSARREGGSADDLADRPRYSSAFTVRAPKSRARSSSTR